MRYPAGGDAPAAAPGLDPVAVRASVRSLRSPTAPLEGASSLMMVYAGWWDPSARDRWTPPPPLRAGVHPLAERPLARAGCTRARSTRNRAG